MLGPASVEHENAVLREEVPILKRLVATRKQEQDEVWKVLK
jgi:hypothetical protein